MVLQMSIMHDRTPRAVRDFFIDIMDKNPLVPIFLFSLHPKEAEDLHLSITSRLLTDSIGTVKLHAAHNQTGAVLFTWRRPGSKHLAKDNYLPPQPTTHTLRFLALKDAHIHIPIDSLPMCSQLHGRPDDCYGLTTPTMMSTTDEEPFVRCPVCHTLPLIGSNEEVFYGPALGTATNANPNASASFGLCRYRGIFADSPAHNATEDECITITGHKWGSVCNDNVPAPGRQGDNPGRTACYNRLGLPLLDDEGTELPALDAFAKEAHFELQKVNEFEDAVVVRGGFIRATNDGRQQWNRGDTLIHKTQSKALSIFGPATCLFSQMPLAVDMCPCPMRMCRSPRTNTRWTWSSHRS